MPEVTMLANCVMTRSSYKLARWVCWTIFISLAAVNLRASDCALTVDVKTPAGDPVTGFHLQLFNSEGKQVADKVVKGPRGTVCDFDFGTHSLRVDWGGCYPTTITGIHYSPERIIHLLVTANPCTYGDTWFGCRIYFRVEDAQHRPIPSVQITNVTGGEIGVTDEYGRIEVRVSKGQAAKFVFNKAGTTHIEEFPACQGQGLARRAVILSDKRDE